MKSTTIRKGQSELGIVEFQGQSFVALGSSVNGRSVVGYLASGKRYSTLALTRWEGPTMLECRADIVKDYRHECHGKTHAVVFHLTRGRFIVGYALGFTGLFRGELIEADDVKEASRAAIAESEYWIERDTEDEENYQAELDDECDDDDSDDD